MDEEIEEAKSLKPERSMKSFSTFPDENLEPKILASVSVNLGARKNLLNSRSFVDDKSVAQADFEKLELFDFGNENMFSNLDNRDAALSVDSLVI